MNATNKTFEIFSSSATKTAKDKCGDAFAVTELKENGVLLLAVADGVSSAPCDWLASKTACEVIKNLFIEKPNVSNLKKYVEEAHHSVIVAQKGCTGMLTSLSLLVLETDTDQIHYTNVGDSAILIGTETKLEQITTDDIASVPVKRDGQTLLINGMPVFRKGVTRSLGQIEPLTIKIFSRALKRNEIIVLVSDGITKDNAFAGKIGDILSRNQWTADLEDFVRNCARNNDDDATLIVCRRNGLDEEDEIGCEICIARNLDFRTQNLNGNRIARFLQNDLRDKLRNDQNAAVHLALDYAELYRLNLERDFIAELLGAALRQGSDKRLVMRLREMIKRYF